MSHTSSRATSQRSSHMYSTTPLLIRPFRSFATAWSTKVAHREVKEIIMSADRPKYIQDIIQGNNNNHRSVKSAESCNHAALRQRMSLVSVNKTFQGRIKAGIVATLRWLTCTRTQGSKQAGPTANNAIASAICVSSTQAQEQDARRWCGWLP